MKLKYNGNTVETQWKYSRNKPSELGEIVNPAAISIYFTERRVVYFHRISLNHFTERRGVYFHCISTVFLPSTNRSLFQIRNPNMCLDQIRARFGYDFARVLPNDRLPMVQIGAGTDEFGTYLESLPNLGSRQKIYR